MKILSITAQKADSTGSGVFLTELVRSFDKAGCRQAVLCGVGPEDPVDLPADVAVYPVVYGTRELPFPVCGMSDEMPYPATRYRDLTQEMTAQLYEAFRQTLRRAVAEFQPDVILCHHLYFLAALAKEEFPQLPVWGQCHGSDLRQLRKNGWQRRRILQGIRALDGIFALHAQQKQAIVELFGVSPDAVTVTGTGYNADVFFTDPALREARVPGKTRLIFAGKLSEKKGLCSLLRAMRLLHKPQGYELILAGGSGSRSEYAAICRLAQCCPCTVRFAGRLTHPQLAQEMNQSDIFVLPSFYEGLPLVLIEAMACGLRTVCTDLPGIRPWLDAAVPGNGTLFVNAPRMYNEDEPFPEDLSAFEQALAEAIETAAHRCAPDQDRIRQVSWDALSKTCRDIWNTSLRR